MEAHCAGAYGGSFDRPQSEQREQVMLGALRRTPSPSGSARSGSFLDMIYANVMEEAVRRSDLWRQQGQARLEAGRVPGVMAAHADNIARFRGQLYSVEPLGIADLLVRAS